MTEARCRTGRHAAAGVHEFRSVTARLRVRLLRPDGVGRRAQVAFEQFERERQPALPLAMTSQRSAVRCRMSEQCRQTVDRHNDAAKSGDAEQREHCRPERRVTVRSTNRPPTSGKRTT